MSEEAAVKAEPTLRTPRPGDGHNIWELAQGSDLDINSPYLYMLWCRDFASTTVLAEDYDGLCGFLIAYARPQDTETLFIWQTAVDPRQKGRRLAPGMLEYVVGDKYQFVECTVASSNTGSDEFLMAFAESRGASVDRTPLLGAELFPREHGQEDLFRIGPIPRRAKA